MDNEMVNTAEAAKILGVTAGCLRAWRTRGTNFIPYLKISPTMCLYAVKDVEAFRTSRLVTEPKKKAA